MPSPTTATRAVGATWVSSTTLTAAASGSVKTAFSSGTAAGTSYKFAVGNMKKSAKQPSRPVMPSAVRYSQCLLRPAWQWLHTPQAQLISPTTLLPSQLSEPLSTKPTNSWPGTPSKDM